MTVEILHNRNPDAACDVQVFVDGVLVLPDRFVSVDPGAGYQRADWDEMKAAEFAEDMSPAFRSAVESSFETADDSKYIED